MLNFIDKILFKTDKKHLIPILRKLFNLPAMKLLLPLILFCLPIFSQVGIGTTEPTETLDVNGTLRLRTVDSPINLSDVEANILVTENSVVKRMSSRDVISRALTSAVKGTCDFSSPTPIEISLGGGSGILPFNIEEFDINEEFDTTSHSYLAKQSGIYEIIVQIEMDATIGVATQLGVRIIKNGTLIHKSSCANVNVLGFNVTPPLRQLKTVIALNTGDTIYFEVEGDIALGSINLAGNSSSNFFSIMQVR